MSQASGSPPPGAPSGSQHAQTAPEARPKAPAPELTGGQRRYLRSLAHPLKPVVMIGEGGISDSVCAALDDALSSHELIKVRLRQPENKKEAATTLAEASGAALCGVVGHTVVLYRPDPDSPTIKLPARGASQSS